MPAQPTVRQRRLATALRQLRQRAGFTLEDATRALNWSSRKIRRWEDAEMSKPVLKEILELLELYGATDDERETVRGLVEEARRGCWWRRAPYADALTPAYDHHIDMESEASELRTWEPHLIPGLFQTVAYARALVSADPRARAASPEADARVLLRTERQRRLLHSPTHLRLLWAILDEAALARVVGGPAVMDEQLTHLLRVSQLPHVKLQVMPFAAGATPAAEPFTVFTSSNPLDLETVNVELLGPGATWYFDAEVVAGYQDLFTASMSSALPVEESGPFIRGHLNKLRKGE